MRICYVLLSPTFGMHQYTADLANRWQAAGDDVHLVTTGRLPRDRYAAEITIHTPINTTDRGFSAEGLRFWELGRVQRTITGLKPDLVHVTGPHLWNPLLLRLLRWAKVPTVHTIHDLHPHEGEAYGRLLYAWNGLVRRWSDHILVHSQRYESELVEAGFAPSRITYSPLLHLFLSAGQEQSVIQSFPAVEYEPWARLLGRGLVYKGLNGLVEAVRLADPGSEQAPCVVIAGPGQMDQAAPGTGPAGVEVRDQLIDDEAALDLFRRCGLIVLPYIEASQTALIAAAYFFHKPVIVTDVGALAEYVIDGETGWVIPPNDPPALAHVLQTALMDSAKLAKMGQAGREWYEKQRRSEELALHQMYLGLL